MTFIVAGKLRNKTFLMADCVVTGPDGKTFTDKVRKAESVANTFFTLAGGAFLDGCLWAFDMRLAQAGRALNIYDISLLRKVIDGYLATDKDAAKIHFERNRIFFITKDAVVYHDIEYDKNKMAVASITTHQLGNDTFIDSAVDLQMRNLTLPADAQPKTFCRDRIDELNRLTRKIDLKDRFTFLEMEDGKELIYQMPYKRMSDFICYLNGIDIEKIDTPEFQWDV